MSLSEQKDMIRMALLQRRAALSSEEREALGRQAQARLLALEAFRSAQVVALYSPIRNEMPTEALLGAALAAGKCVCYPCVVEAHLHFYQVNSSADMQVGSFGVREPHRNGMEFGLERIELMLVPGVVFDLCGHRLGYGRGYFDRLLAKRVFAGLRVGFGYDFQLVERLPIESHDQELDLLVTDKRIFSPSRGMAAGSP